MAYVHNAPWYYAADGTPVQAVATEEGWTYPQAPVDDDGAHVQVIDDPATVLQLNTQALGFNPDDKVVNPDQSVSIMNPQTQQYEQAVAAGESGALMPISMAQEQNLPIYQYAQEPVDTGTLGQIVDIASPLAQLAAAAAAGNFIGNGLNMLPGFGGDGEVLSSIVDSVAPSEVASYTAPEAVGMGSGGGLQVGNLPDLTSLADLTVQNAGSGGLAAGGNVGGLGLTTGSGAGLGSLAELAAGGLGAGLATGGLGLGGVTAGLTGAATGATAADYAATQAADDAAAGANASGVAAPAGTGVAGNVYGTAAGAGTALSRILGGTGTAADWTSILGNVAGAGLGAYASNEQSNALSDLANKYFDLGAPSRGRYEASMTSGFDPMSIPGYSAAVDNSMNSMLRKLSTQGNPFGNPGGLIEANKSVVAGTALPALQNYQGQNAATGGFNTYNAAAPAANTAAIGSTANIYNSIGGGIANLTNPRSSLEDLLKRYGGGSMALA